MSSTMVLERGLFFGAAGNSAVAPSPAGLATGAAGIAPKGNEKTVFTTMRYIFP